MDDAPEIPNEPHRVVLRIAVGTTVLIAVGAFVLSFAALTDLATRSGMVYPWALLFFGTIVSTAVSSTHAILSVDSISNGVPPLVSALMAAVSPVVLVAITHLTAPMYRKKSEAAKLREAHEFDAERGAAPKCGVAYDDGCQAALTDAQTAEGARPGELEQEYRNALARARAEAITGEGKAPLYDDRVQCLNRP